VIVGGIIPDEEVPLLLAAGVAKVFHPGTSMDEVVAFVQQEAEKVQQQYQLAE
jgi:methylmalonyl-CoA mutase C-terminal domain/subunit